MLYNILVVHRFKPHSKEGPGLRLEMPKLRIFITEVQWDAGLMFCSASLSACTRVCRGLGEEPEACLSPSDPFQKAWPHLGCDTEASRKLTCSLHGFWVKTPPLWREGGSSADVSRWLLLSAGDPEFCREEAAPDRVFAQCMVIHSKAPTPRRAHPAWPWPGWLQALGWPPQ